MEVKESAWKLRRLEVKESVMVSEIKKLIVNKSTSNIFIRVKKLLNAKKLIEDKKSVTIN